jgi:hypothetical protein
MENDDICDIDIREIYENALKDPTLLSSLNINDLLDTLENDSNSYLQNKTLKSINKEVYETISEIGCDEEKHVDLYTKMMGYRVVNEICELHTGKYIKAIRRGCDPKISVMGIVTNLEFRDKGVLVRLVKYVSAGRPIYMNYLFDNYITFQKLSDNEQLILMAYDTIDEHDS